MFNINQFLNKIRAHRSTDEHVRFAVCKALLSQVKMTVPPEAVEIKPPRIFIKNISQVARSEIFIKKEALLAEINVSHKGRVLTDIR